MAVVIPRSVMDQFQWRRRTTEVFPAPSVPAAILSKDVEAFRPKESGPAAKAKVVLPFMLQGGVGARGGLNTWLATRKAESDKRIAENDIAEVTPNKWLAGGRNLPYSGCSRAAAVREGLLKARQLKEREETITSREKQASPQMTKKAVDLKSSVRMGLLQAWSGEKPVRITEKMQTLEIVRTEVTHSGLTGPKWMGERYQSKTNHQMEPWAPASPCPPKAVWQQRVAASPSHMARNYASIYSAAERNGWLSTPQRIEKQGTDKQGDANHSHTAADGGARNPSHGETLRKALLCAWDGKAVDERVPPLPEQAAPSPAEALRRSLLNAWDKSASTEVPHDAVREPVKSIGSSPSRAETLRLALLSAWKPEGATQHPDPAMTSADQEESWSAMDDSCSEASIMTLDTVTDISEDFDDFSDMKHELCQWISKD